MGRWHSEYRRTHRGLTSDQLLTTWRDNFTERRHLRETMMSSHFQLGAGNGGSSSSSSTESFSDLQLSPTRLRLRHLALTSPERAPPAPSAPPAPPAPPALPALHAPPATSAPPAAGGRSVRFEVPPEGERPTEAPQRRREATERSTETTARLRHAPTSSEMPVSSPAPPPSAVVDRPRPFTAPAPRASSGRVPAAGGRHRPRHRSRSPDPPASPLLGYGYGERDRDVGDQRTYNVTAPPAQVHETARVAAERRRRDAALEALVSHGRPPPRPAGLWTTEYQRCFCQPVWAAERARSGAHRPRSGIR